MKPFRSSLVITLSFLTLSAHVYGDIGKSVSDLSGIYGKSVADKPTSTGRIVAWKGRDGGVVMAEFGPDGMARNMVYRVKGSLTESAIASYLSKNSGGSGSYHKVDVPELNSILNNLPNLVNDPNAPEQVKKFALAMSPQAIANLSQTINGAGDLRATKDGKYLAMIDTRGQILVLKVDGPSLPLL